MMWPVLVTGLKWVTQGLPLVPPVKPSQLNFSWGALCRVVQLRQPGMKTMAAVAAAPCRR